MSRGRLLPLISLIQFLQGAAGGHGGSVTVLGDKAGGRRRPTWGFDMRSLGFKQSTLIIDKKKKKNSLPLHLG